MRSESFSEGFSSPSTCAGDGFGVAGGVNNPAILPSGVEGDCEIGFLEGENRLERGFPFGFDAAMKGAFGSFFCTLKDGTKGPEV